jgi:hypothetical protein
MIAWAVFIGGFVRWIFKGFRTRLIDELEGNLDAKWGSSYDIENAIIGYISVAVLFTLVILAFFM